MKFDQRMEEYVHKKEEMLKQLKDKYEGNLV